MPIRMEKDPDQNRGNNNNGGKKGGGMNPMFLIISALLFLFKKPKYALLVLAVGFLLYYFGGGTSNIGGENIQLPEQLFETGLSMDEDEYYKAEIFEPLASNYNSFPSKVSLLQYAPSRGHQGRQGSCVGWASAYSAQTIQYAMATGGNPNQIVFSPSYLYNQIALPNCQGSYLAHALQVMKNDGLLPLSQFPYDESSCSRKPSSVQKQSASRYTIRGYNRLTSGSNPRNFVTDMDAIRQNIAKGAPVVIGMEIPESFMFGMEGKNVWEPTRRDYMSKTYGGHAMTVIGYDDNAKAFQLMNSWGAEWGNRGTTWVPYKAFEDWVREAYGLYPMGKAQDADPNKLSVQFGIVDMAREATLNMRQTGDYIFRTASPVKTGDKFKILVNNSVECYTYVFGEETDGSSYVLFPYTEKHSPYCGITGTRLFPRDYSMVPDNLGNKDRIAIVISKKPLNFDQLNAGINQSNRPSYAQKLFDVLGNQRIKGVKFKAGETISFEADAADKNIVGIVIEMDKI